MGSSPPQFDISPSSGAPIYRQIIDQVLAMVAGGRLRPGDLLPSVRAVAKSAEVNPMTVSKAYSQLESEGVVERVRGQGMRVLNRPQQDSLAKRRKQFRELLRPALQRAYQLGLSEEDVRQAIESLIEENLVEGSPAKTSNR